MSIGILVFEGEAFEDAQELTEKGHSVDLMGDVIPQLIRVGKPVYGYVSNAFWYDVGSMEAYEKLNSRKVKDTTSFLF